VKQKNRVNEQIRVPKVRVVFNGRQLGVVPTEDAMRLAKDQGLDLVEVAPKENPPVCIVIDYGKWQYQQQKQAKTNKAKSKNNQLKEIRLTPNIGKHDIETKAKQMRVFLQEGKSVKISVRYSGREIVHVESGKQLLDSLMVGVEDVGKIDGKPRLEGKSLSLRIMPKE